MNMVLNELQLGLIGLGAAAVVSVFAYNKWQEAKHRRMAERIFSADNPDVLLEPREPVASASNPPKGMAADPLEDTLNHSLREPGIELPPPQVEEAIPLEALVEPPLTAISDDSDCLVRLEAAEAVAAPLLWPAQHDALPNLTKPVLWYGLNEKKHEWEALNSHSAGRYRVLRAALQLVDRRGPLEEAEVSRFFAGMGQVANRFMAVLELPTKADVLGRAADLDAFCAHVDVQVAVNIVSKDDHGFAGTKLRGVAQAAGLSLGHDGMFHATDDQGHSIFSLANLEPEPFGAEELKVMVCHAITLVLDVPRTPDGVQAFQRMLHVAGQLAMALNGLVVDDNRVPLDENAARVILGKIKEFQKSMAERNIPAGGVLALRLFS